MVMKPLCQIKLRFGVFKISPYQVSYLPANLPVNPVASLTLNMPVNLSANLLVNLPVNLLANLISNIISFHRYHPLFG